MSFIFRFLELLLSVLTLTIFFRTLLSWVSLGQTNMLTRLLFQITEPMLAPLRRIIPRIGALDLSPLAAVIILQVISTLISRL
ncbi:MAG: YggT family protein [Dehalococcoidales bacterium]